MTVQGQNPIEQQMNSFAGKIDSLQFFMFLVNPKTQHLSFEDYLATGGTIPDKFRESLYGLARIGSMFGFDADINGDVTEMIAGLSPQMMVNILKGIDPETFETTLDDNSELSGIIAKIAQPIINDEIPKMSLSEATDLIGMEINWGDELGALTIAEARDPSGLTHAISDMSNNETLNFLKSLTPDLQEVVRAGLLKDTDGLDISGMSLEDAIRARADYGEENINVKGWFTLKNPFNRSSDPKDSSVDKVYDNIRGALPEHISVVLNDRIEALGQDGATMPKIDPKKLHAMLHKKIEDGSLLAILQENGRMEKIKEDLIALSDHSFLVNLLPPEIKDAALFNKLREGMAQFGLLGPIGAIVMQFSGFILNLAQQHLPRFIGQDKADQVVAKLEGFVDPTLNYQEPVEPPQNVSLNLAEQYKNPQEYLKQEFADIFGLDQAAFDDIKAGAARGVHITGGELPENYLSMSRAEYIAYKASEWRENIDFGKNPVPSDVLKTAQDLLKEHNVPDPNDEIARGIAFGAVEMQKRFAPAGKAQIVLNPSGN